MNTATTSYAETLGMIAFEKGNSAQPGADKQLMDAVKEVGSISKEGITLMRAWMKGWHTANLMSGGVQP